MPLFRRAEFYKSAQEPWDLPLESRCEVAFAGRSNAGKSSALNTLAGHGRLAFVSKTPGRTQLMNYFSLGHNRFLVDLPGYGYAKVAKQARKPWGRLLGEYLRTRTALSGLVLVMDIRHPMSELDRTLFEWFYPTGKPVHVLLSKADKLSRTQAMTVLRDLSAELSSLSTNWTAQLFSSLKRTGIDEAEAVVEAWFGHSPENEKVLRELSAAQNRMRAGDVSPRRGHGNKNAPERVSTSPEPGNKKPRAKGE
jgi:GTP-binding protein